MVRVFGVGILIVLVMMLMVLLWFRSKSRPVSIISKMAVSADTALWAAPDSGGIA